ncbi:MAG TPA: STAS domain-containing protein [Conexibacter sp.]|nr:STAS domain-containing protein [Conexibacter sp.]
MTGQQYGPAAPFAAHIARDDDRTLVRLIGELDGAVVEQAERAIALAEQRRPRILEVDLSTLAFMDSTCLRLMLQARRRARDEGRAAAAAPRLAGSAARVRGCRAAAAVRVRRLIAPRLGA